MEAENVITGIVVFGISILSICAYIGLCLFLIRLGLGL